MKILPNLAPTFLAAMLVMSMHHLASAQSKPLEEKDFNTKSGSLYEKTGFYEKTFWVHSPSNKASREVLVILPPDYFKSTKKYPVIIYLNGITQKPSSGASIAKEYMIPAIKKGTVKPMIWVGVHAGKETMCADSKDGKIMIETWVNKEAVPWIDSTFRTYGDGAHRGIEGNSQGGFCALLYANKYPDLYGSVMAWCPALWGAESFAIPGRHIDNGHNLGVVVGTKMYNNDVEYARLYNPWNTWNLHPNKLRKIPIHILVGQIDNFRRQDSLYAKLLDSLGVPVSFRIVPGAKHGASKIQALLTNPAEPYEFHSKHLHGATTSFEARVVRSGAQKAEGKQAGKLVLPGVDRYRREAGPGYDARGVAVPWRGAAEASEAVGSK